MFNGNQEIQRTSVGDANFLSFSFLNSWLKVQFCDKSQISTLTFSSPVDVVTEHFCVRDNILTRKKSIQGLFQNLYLVQYKPSFVLYSVFETSVLVSYLVLSPRFVPGSRFIPSPESGVRSPESGVGTPQSAVRSPQSAVRSPQSAVRSPQSTVHSPQSTVHSPQSTVHSPQSTVLICADRI